MCLGYTQWKLLRSEDGSLVFYFNPRTRQLWGGDLGGDSDSGMIVDEGIRQREPSGSDARTPRDGDPFSDDDIEMAARIARMVRLRPFVEGPPSAQIRHPSPMIS